MKRYGYKDLLRDSYFCSILKNKEGGFSVAIAKDVYVESKVSGFISSNYEKINRYNILYTPERSLGSPCQYREGDQLLYWKVCDLSIEVGQFFFDICIKEESDVVYCMMERAEYLLLCGKEPDYVVGVIENTLKDYNLFTSGGHWKGLNLYIWKNMYEVTRSPYDNWLSFWRSDFICHCPDELLPVAWENAGRLNGLLRSTNIDWGNPRNRITSIYETMKILEIVADNYPSSYDLIDEERYESYKKMWITRKRKRLPKDPQLLYTLAIFQDWDGFWDFSVPYDNKNIWNILGHVCPGQEHLETLDLAYARWVARGHRELPINTLSIPREMFESDTSYERIMAYHSELVCGKEFDRISRRYDTSSIRSVIPSCEVQEGNYVAYVLSPQDKMWTMLGYETNCCQHLDGAGETAMMYGALSEFGGFWAVRKKGRIIAQAEIWQDKEGSLVFDNIELSNNRDMSEISDILYKWSTKSPYDTIILGKGYTDISLKCYPEAPVPKQVRCPKIYEKVYTDTNWGCVYLKKGGVVYGR